MLFGQSFQATDLWIIAVLVVLEGVLSIDNALVLGLLAKRLPKDQQQKALTYGLIGALVFRIIAIATAAWLIRIWWIKLLGGLYLVYVSLKHFLFESKDPSDETVKLGPDGHPILEDAQTGQPLAGNQSAQELAERSPVHAATTASALSTGLAVGAYEFWSTVAVIELTDIAFAVDSILAAVGMVRGPDKTWVIILGGFIGVILMRFAAALFIKLLDRFPRLELSAYLLVLVIGVKLVLDWAFNKPPPGTTAHDYHPPLDFHSTSSPAFWLFWGLMVASFAIGFLPQRAKTAPANAAALDRPGGREIRVP